MAADRKIKVALAGLSFGAEFVPIFLHHPHVESLTICDSDPVVLQKIGDRFEVEKRVLDLEDVLADDSIDAVHLVTPIPMHAEQTVAVLNAGKHCACTVPMAISIADLHAIIAAQRASGKNYMGMETAVYTRRFLHVQEMVKRGEIGRIQFLRGAHYQDMEFWPPYWMGLPPMFYATHAVSPVLALAETQAKAVHCFGSGVMRPELHKQYGNPSRSKRPSTSSTMIRRWPPRSRAASSIRRAATPRASTLTAIKPPSSGNRSKGSRRSSFACNRLSPAGGAATTSGPSVWMCPTGRTCCRQRLRASPSAASMMSLRRTCLSCRAAATAARTRTWCMNSSAASWKSGRPGPMR